MKLCNYIILFIGSIYLRLFFSKSEELLKEYKYFETKEIDEDGYPIDIPQNEIHFDARFSDININNRQVDQFYIQLLHNINLSNDDIFKMNWIVSFEKTHDLIDNADIGGYSKAIFSHFAKYCLFYDDELIKDKENILNKKLDDLKRDYKILCTVKDYVTPSSGIVTSGESSYTYIKSHNKKPELKEYCDRLDLLKSIKSVDDAKYKELNKEDQEKIKIILNNNNDIVRNMGITKDDIVRNIRNIGITNFWWKEIKNILIEEYQEIKCAQESYNFKKKQSGWIPFVLNINDSTKRISFKINPNLDVNKIKETTHYILNVYFIIVGQMFGKYITQELPIWQKPQNFQYATNYIPMGQFLALLILNDISKLTKKAVYDTINYDHDNINYLENLLKSEYDDIVLPVNDSDIVSEETINKMIKYFVCHDEDELKTYFDNFLIGIKKMVIDPYRSYPTEQIQPIQLTQIFTCEKTEQKNKFINLLKKEKVKFINEKLDILDTFIELIEGKDPKDLVKLYEFFSGISCCPDNININFNENNDLFTSHLCSNGLDFPNLSIDTQKKLDHALMTSLAAE